MEELQLIKKMEKNGKLIREDYDSLQKQYANKFIAINEGKIIEYNQNVEELKKTLENKKINLTTILVQFIPEKGVEILY